MKNSNLGKDNILKLFVGYCAPAVVGMVVSGAQSILDGVFLGRFVSLNAMAAVNIVVPFLQIIFAVAFVVCIGAVSKAGRLLGTDDADGARVIFRTAFVFNIIVSVGILLVGVCFSRQIAHILGASGELIDDAATYLFYSALFSPIVVNMFLCGFCNRVIGKPYQYLSATVISFFSNVFLNYLFIVKLQMRVKGAAIATGLAYAVAFAITILPFLKKNGVLNLYSGKIRFREMVDVCLNGSSEAVGNLSTALTVYLFNITLFRLAGNSGIAAFTIISYISVFATLIMFGVSDGVSPIVSFNYGSGQIDRVKKTLRVALLFNAVAGVCIFFTVFFGAEKLLRMFADETADVERVIPIAAVGAKIYAFNFLLVGINIVVSGFFTAVGKAAASLIVEISRSLLWVVAGITVLPVIFGINGVWLTVPVAEFLTFITSSALLIYSLEKLKTERKPL